MGQDILLFGTAMAARCRACHREEKPLSRDCRLAGRSGDGLAFLLDLSAHGEVRRVVALKRGVGDRTPERFADHPGGSDLESGHSHSLKNKEATVTCIPPSPQVFPCEPLGTLWVISARDHRAPIQTIQSCCEPILDLLSQFRHQPFRVDAHQKELIIAPCRTDARRFWDGQGKYAEAPIGRIRL